MTSKLPEDKAHVYFYTLPVGTKYIHKGEQYTKIGEECAKDSNGKEWRFEMHYGCVIDKALADEIGIEKTGHRPID